MSGIFVAQLNPEYRIVITPAAGSVRVAWSIERLAPGGEWQDYAGAVRSAKTLRWLVAGCGPIDDAAQAKLRALPPRVDIVAMSPEERLEAALAKRRKRPRVETTIGTGSSAPEAMPAAQSAAPMLTVPIAAVETAPAPVPPSGPPARPSIALAPRTCATCGEEFTPVAPAYRARQCSPACRRKFATRYQRDRRARDEGFHERARQDQAARRQASKARREAREIALATAAAQPIDSYLAEYWRINHGVRL